MVKVTSVGSSWKTVPLDNSYTNPIIVCTYNLPSISDNEATVRVQSVGAGFQVKIQRPVQSTAVTASDVYCTISEEGDYTYPIKYEAHKVESDQTNHGTAAGRSIALMENVTANKVLSYSQPVVLGQVMTTNNEHFSVFWSNNCSSRVSPPSNAGTVSYTHLTLPTKA